MRIERAQANREAYGVGLNLREVILSAWQMNRVAVDGEDISRNIVAGAHALERGGVGSSDSSKLSATTATAPRWSNWRHDEVVNHPAFVPARFIVDDE